MSRIFLGIDIGTTSAKGLTVSEEGEILALARHPYPLLHPRQDWAEQDPEDYWRGLVDVTRQCVAQCHGREIAALALSTQGDTLIVTDGAGKALYPAISWMDNRASAECRELLAETGRSFWVRESGMGLTALSSACKIRWIARHRPELREPVARICSVPDYLAVRLTGRFATDTPSASWTPCFTPGKRQWSQSVMDQLGVSRENLPEVLESGTPIGALLPEVASELGLGPETVLVAGAFDQAAAACGAGVSAGNRSILSCGTAWVLYAVSESPVEDPLEQIPVCCHTGESEWGMVLPFPGGSAYDWFARTFQGGNRQGGGEGDSLVFVPHLYGGLSPDWRGESRGSLLGLTLAHTWGDVRLALMRGIASEARRNVEAAERLCGRIPSIRMAGGASKSETWPQMIANLLARPVEVSDFAESACYGAAKLAAGAISEPWPDPFAPRRFEPEAEGVEAEERRYARYISAYSKLLEIYES